MSSNIDQYKVCRAKEKGYLQCISNHYIDPFLPLHVINSVRRKNRLTQLTHPLLINPSESSQDAVHPGRPSAIKCTFNTEIPEYFFAPAQEAETPHDKLAQVLHSTFFSFLKVGLWGILGVKNPVRTSKYDLSTRFRDIPFLWR